jgi:hypothetical protein
MRKIFLNPVSALQKVLFAAGAQTNLAVTFDVVGTVGLNGRELFFSCIILTFFGLKFISCRRTYSLCMTCSHRVSPIVTRVS